MPSFNLRGTHFFLTYPQCPIATAEALNSLKEKIPDIQEWIVATENHEDGNKHLHVYLKLGKKTRIQSTLLDLGEHHGNYQLCRSPSAVTKYVTKDGDYIASSGMKAIIEKLFKEKIPDIYFEARKRAREDGISAGLQYLEERKGVARDLTLYGGQIAKNLPSTKKLKVEFDLESFNWNIPWDRKRQTLILWGNTNTGKTALAKALIPEGMMTRHLDLLKNARPEGIILDDMSFKHLHREAQIALVDRQEDTQIHIRYTVAEIAAGTPVIITTNNLPCEIVNIEDGAIDRRCLCVKVGGVGSYSVRKSP